MKTEVKLFVDSQFISPYAMSVYVTLIEKGILFDLLKIEQDASQNMTPAYNDVSLTARVPTLQHGSFYLSESKAIVEYLEEVFPAPEYPSVLPQEQRDRARARQIQAWIRSDLMPIREERPTKVIFFQPIATPLSQSGHDCAHSQASPLGGFPDLKELAFAPYGDAGSLVKLHRKS